MFHSKSQTVFNYLAEATVLIVKFDSVLKNGQLHVLWSHYAKAISLAEQNVHKFNVEQKFDREEIAGLSNVLQKIDYLFSGDLFQVSDIRMQFEMNKKVISMTLLVPIADFDRHNIPETEPDCRSGCFVI